VGFDCFWVLVPLKPGGCGFTPPWLWQSRQVEPWFWVWQAAQEAMFVRAATEWFTTQFGGCGSRRPAAPGATCWKVWQLWQ
jgi:hypothetical protein